MYFYMNVHISIIISSKEEHSSNVTSTVKTSKQTEEQKTYHMLTSMHNALGSIPSTKQYNTKPKSNRTNTNIL
jgi:hypothetical protein